MAACRMTEQFNEHQTVLLQEAIHALTIKPDHIYVDATFGRGGHSQLILNQLGPSGKLFAFDKDPAAVAYAKKHFSSDPRFYITHASFAEIEQHLKSVNVSGKIAGILFDLGVSSPQLDDASRGFSFMRSGKLDMRMDNTKGEDAATWLSHVSEQELANILWIYGEERFSRRIARAIVENRKITPIQTTEALAKIIKEAHPAWEKGKHPATRSFQAIRIHLNKELDDLETALDQALNVMMVGGKLVVISFHSLEDRLVKKFIQHHERGVEFPRGLAIKQESIHSRLKKVGHAIKASPKEIDSNPRARSAVLRIAEKLL